MGKKEDKDNATVIVDSDVGLLATIDTKKSISDK